MPIPLLFPILAAAGVAAAAVALISRSAREHEKQREKAAELERQAVRGHGQRERVKLRAEVDHKQWILVRTDLRMNIELAKVERRRLYKDLSYLKEERRKVGARLRDIKKIEDRFGKRAIREAFYEFDDAVDRQYASAYRWTAVIDQLYRLKDDLYGPSLDIGALAKASRRFDLESTFKSTDVPIRGQIVTGIVRAPKRGLWFQLDCSIRAHLIKREQDHLDQSWSKGERVRLFVEGADYRNGTAVVSVAKARFIDAWEDGRTTWRGEVVGKNASGVRVDIGATTVFVPRSKIPSAWKGTSQATVDLLEVDPRLRTVVGRLVVRRS